MRLKKFDGLFQIADLHSLADNESDGRKLLNFVVAAIDRGLLSPRNSLGLKVHHHFTTEPESVSKCAHAILEADRPRSIADFRSVTIENAVLAAKHEMEKFRLKQVRSFSLAGFITAGDIEEFFASEALVVEWLILDNNNQPVSCGGRKSATSAFLEEAIKRAGGFDNSALIWAELQRMADEKFTPLIGFVDRELKYVAADGDVKFFSRKNLTDSLARKRRRSR